MSPPDEARSRRPDFLGGPAVTLSDGNPWHLPRPLSYFAMDDDDAGVKRRWNLGDEYETLFARYQQAVEDMDFVTGELALGTFLLLRNYDLTPAQAGGLLRFGYGRNADPGAVAVREAVMAVVAGRDAEGEDSSPKPSGDGPG